LDGAGGDGEENRSPNPLLLAEACGAGLVAGDGLGAASKKPPPPKEVEVVVFGGAAVDLGLERRSAKGDDDDCG
jgi:hypothetical protein